MKLFASVALPGVLKNSIISANLKAAEKKAEKEKDRKSRAETDFDW